MVACAQPHRILPPADAVTHEFPIRGKRKQIGRRPIEGPNMAAFAVTHFGILENHFVLNNTEWVITGTDGWD